MAQVVITGEAPDGLPAMVAGLVEANIEADPSKARIIESTRGAIQIDVPDAGATLGLKFVPGTLTIASGSVPGADVRITADSETLLSLSTVPLRFGLPDALTEDGRAVGGKLLTGALRVRGLPLGLPLMRRLHRLMNISH